MDKFIIRGGNRLNGTVEISGAKNATLALMPAVLLSGGVCRLSNAPRLRDISTMSALLEQMGMGIKHPGTTLELDASAITHFEAPYDLVKKMRASFYVLGPLLAKFGSAKVSYPGGCAWGPRPVDLHIKALQKLGAEIEIEQGYVLARAKRLHGAPITFDVSSVGATGNTMMAAVLARGTTLIDNAAIEPEITQLAEFLVSMGAKINGVGTSRLEIQGVDALHAADIETIPDRIEAGTFLVAAALCGGTITLTGVEPMHLDAVIGKLEDAGARVTIEGRTITLAAPRTLTAVDVTANIYPGFPTDMQAQWTALMALTDGTSVVTDTIYFDRFKHIPEMIRLGADIEVKDNAAIVRGVRRLTGAKVMSTDLRASASLILAGLVAEGTTEVLRVYHLDRGYETIERKLRALGADIERVAGEEF